MQHDLICKGVVLCDEIRQEANGKYIILGVYSAGIAVQQLPAQLGLSLYLILQFPKEGQHKLYIKAAHANHQANIEVGIDILTTKYPMAIPTPQLPMTFTEPGELIVSVGLDADSMIEVARFDVVANPQIWTMFPSEPQQLDGQSQNGEPN